MTPTTEQLKDLLAMAEAGYSGAWDHLGKMAPTLAAEVVRLRAIIEKVDQYSPVADDTCDELGITLTEAIMREWPELRPPSP